MAVCVSLCPLLQVAAELRAKVAEATGGLTCSVGIAPNMMLAKIASDKNKPNGQCAVGATRVEVMAFISDLPIRKVGLCLCTQHHACRALRRVVTAPSCQHMHIRQAYTRCHRCMPQHTQGMLGVVAHGPLSTSPMSCPLSHASFTCCPVLLCLSLPPSVTPSLTLSLPAVCLCTQIPGIGKVTEQVLQALGVSTCSDLIKQAPLITALMSDVSSSSLMQAGLGLGATQHSSRGARGPGSSEPGRKGISCERTFGAMSTAVDMEQMVRAVEGWKETKDGV